MKKLLIILSFLPLLVFSQNEKRLALVIGNANYDKGELKNPVNDALLVSQTLNQLSFDIILDTNIKDRSSFIETIREFGAKRPNYDIAFVYYAGHGVQIDGENYLLPTKENFESKNDVQDYGIHVQALMRYLETSKDSAANIIILDACRDNPFEGNWTDKTRSLNGNGGGLAAMSATGSLIAFSTEAGKTAKDGDGDNSAYCESLCKNMMIKNISMTNVFRNVRSELSISGQSTAEYDQLIGGEIILNYDPNIKLDDIENSAWSGTYRQHLNHSGENKDVASNMSKITGLSDGSYPIELIINNFSEGKISAIIKYPSLGCSGLLILKEKSTNDRYLFVEDLKENNGGCINDGYVIIELVNENTMMFYWYYGDDYYFDYTVYHIPEGHMGAACILTKQ